MLSLDTITLGVPEVSAARDFYTAALSAAVKDDGDCVSLDLHGTGQVALSQTATLAEAAGTSPAVSGFRGYLLSLVVDQPAEVQALVDTALRGGAELRKPAKKMMFAGFSAVYQAPDGALWKVAAPTRKDAGPAGNPPLLTESIAILGVVDPQASKAFYTALGMSVDRDYGNKFVDFRLSPGKPRLALMQRKALAKDAGVDVAGDGFPAVVFHTDAGSRERVDDLMAAAETAGGRVAVAAAQTEHGYCGHFTDPDGFWWKVSSA